MTIARDFVAAHEGCKLEAYKDQAGVWTCGYGSTGAGIQAGTVWTQAEANERLESDLHVAQLAVRRQIATALSEQQEAALVSFVFNLGEGALAGSTLRALLNQGDLMGAAKQFEKWCRVNNTENKGLLIRRFEEAALFLRGSTI